MFGLGDIQYQDANFGNQKDRLSHAIMFLKLLSNNWRRSRQPSGGKGTV